MLCWGWDSGADSVSESEFESASDAESQLVSDSETDSGLYTQCTIRVQYFDVIALSIFLLRRGIITMNMVAIAHQMISSEWN